MAEKLVGFEGQTDGATVTAGGSATFGDAPYTISIGASATLQWLAAAAMGGTGIGLRFTSPNTNVLTIIDVDDVASASADFTVQFRYRHNAQPSALLQMPANVRSTTGGGSLGRLEINTSNQIRVLAGAANATASTALTVGSDYIINYYGTGFNSAATTSTVEVYTPAGVLVTSASVTGATTAALVDRVRYGKIANTGTCSGDIDSIKQNVGSATPYGVTSPVTSDLDIRWKVVDIAPLPYLETTVETDGFDSEIWAENRITFMRAPVVEITTVVSDVDLRWAVRAVASSDHDLRWAIRSVASSDVDLRWAVRAVASSDHDLRWAVRSTLSSDHDFRWAVRNRVTSDLDARWAVRATIGSDHDFRWAVRAVASSDVDLRWAVRGRVTSDLDARWGVRSAVSSDLNTLWGIRAQVDSALDLRWAVISSLTTVTSDLALAWLVSGRVLSDVDLRWRVQAALTSDVDLRWRVQAALTSDVDLRWRVLNRASSDVDLRWAVRAVASSDHDLRWAVRSTIGSDVTLVWRARAVANSDLSIRWAVQFSGIVGSAPFAVSGSDGESGPYVTGSA